MAEKDLGSIPYTNINQGTRLVDRSGEARAVVQGLGVAKQAVDEGIKANVTGKMLDAIEETESPIINPEPQEFVPGSREEYLSNKMDRLTAMIEQGKTSQQTLAQQQVLAILNEAQAKYDWLYDDLARRAGSVLSGSARMKQLGIDDDIREAVAAQAQSDYDDIVNHARGDWEKQGGLGIDPAIDPRSAYFIRLYEDRQELRNTQQHAARVVGMAVANAQLSVHDPEVFAQLNGALQGTYSSMAAEWQELKLVHQYDQLVTELYKGAQGDLTFIEQWKTVNADAMVDDVMARKAILQNLWDGTLAVEPELLRTDRGKDMEARFKDAIADYDQWIQAIRNIKEDVPGAETVIQRSHAIRANDAFNEISAVGQEHISFFTAGPGAAMLELAAELKNAQGVNMANQVALASQTYLGERFPELFDTSDPMYDATQQAAYFKSTGALQIPPGAGAAEIQSRINQVQKNPDASFVVPGRNNEEMTILALQTKDLHLELLKAAQSVIPDTDNAEFANNSLLGLTYSLSYLNDGPNAPNVQEDMINSLADGSLDNAVNTSLSQGPSGARNAFGAEAQMFYMSTDPHRTRQEMGNHYKDHRIGGVALSEMVAIDADELDKGRFVWVINDDLLTQAGDAMAASGFQSGFITTQSDRAASRRRAEQMINEEMQTILNTINQQLAIEMMLNKAKATNPNQLQQEDDWTSFFLGVGDPAGPTNSWSNYFNYTQEGKASRSK